MNAFHRTLATIGVAAWLVCAAAGSLFGQTAPDQYKPTVGQPGKDAVWVPTAPALVEKMLDMAKVTPADFVMDLGSGDGRNIIAAAKRGARGVGVEYNPDLVGFSNRTAASEGVADKAKFVQGDMYAADISQATVLALFLLTENLDRLVPKFLALKPGTRIVANTFGMSGWTPDETDRLDQECTNWCTSLLWIVPAKVEGNWQLADGELTFKQEFQMLTGGMSLKDGAKHAAEGRLRGDQIRFTIDGADYEGRVDGSTMDGTVSKGGKTTRWKATRR
jgi:SAM-dependent methyltransferase